MEPYEIDCIEVHVCLWSKKIGYFRTSFANTTFLAKTRVKNQTQKTSEKAAFSKLLILFRKYPAMSPL